MTGTAFCLLVLLLLPVQVFAQSLNAPPALPPLNPVMNSQGSSSLEENQQIQPVQAYTSILKPGLPVYKYSLGAIDPTSENNPSGKGFPGNRGANQVVIYTPASGIKTGTNAFGAEAIILDNIVQSVDCCDSLIPPNGFVVSAHGQAGEWLKKKITPGMVLEVDQGARLVMFQNTPDAFVRHARQYLDVVKQAQKTDSSTISSVPLPSAKPLAASLLEDAENCVANLETFAAKINLELAASTGNENPVVKTMLKDIRQESKECQTRADQAYYQLVQSKPEEFRGIWLRPLEKTPEQIQKTVERLKALNIHDIFIETYYQGKTIYPSQVMRDYGLSAQHPRYAGMEDPLAQWVEIAHRNGLKVHVWAQVFFAGNKDENAELYGPILNQYPQWTNIERKTLCPNLSCKLASANQLPPPSPSEEEPGHYFLDPANPEVQTFLGKLLDEMVSNYAVDGVNLDYIRYPATFSLQSGRYLQSNWGYTPSARQGFMNAMKERLNTLDRTNNADKTGPLRYDPIRLIPSSPLWPQWVEWRKAQVTRFVSHTVNHLREKRPELYLTAVVFPLSDPKSQVKLQDWPLWVKEGYLNALTPIGLYPTPAGIFKDSMGFREMTQDKVPVYVGIFGAYNRLAPAEFVAQIDAAHKAGMPGIMLFEHSRLSEPYREALQRGPFRE
ncbi:MAG: family 10 glycosylhydrolase [Vampirovibrionales bacterium]|nr:family 10 glycosylhydrolase [Vampirovibrionales bacterium]